MKFAAAAALIVVVACTGNGGGGNTVATASPSGTQPASTGCTGATASKASAGPAPGTPALTVPAGLTIRTIARVPQARELAALPNGDVLVGTLGSALYIVPHAESATPGLPHVFADVGDAPANGIAFAQSLCAIFVGTQHGIVRIAYSDGQLAAASQRRIALLRQGPVAPNSDGDIHSTTSVAFANGTLYAGVGSSCNACVEVDATRASIQQMNPDGTAMRARATRIRNAVALAVNPASGHLWVGDAGQDALPAGHPFEFVDDVSSHTGIADYGWPACEERHVAYTAGAQCSSTVAPAIEFPAYLTHIGAVFYPQNSTAAHAIGSVYAGALFVTSHGSWHAPNGCTLAPEVDYVPMHGDVPAQPVNWSDPKAQWRPFVSGFQPSCSSRIGRPTGIAVGAQGSVFIADDQSGVIYRVRP